MIGKTLTLDLKKLKEYPKIIWKENTESYIRLHLEFEDGKTYFADVINITSNGKYLVKIFDKI